MGVIFYLVLIVWSVKEDVEKDVHTTGDRYPSEECTQR